MLELVVGFRRQGFINLLDLSCQKVVSRPLTQQLQNF